MSIDDLTEVPVPLEYSVSLLNLQASGTISGRIAKDVFEEMLETNQSPEEIVKTKNLIQISDDTSIAKICEQVLLENPNVLQDYLSGKEKLFGFFVGQAMKLSGGKLNPGKVNEVLKKLLDSRKTN